MYYFPESRNGTHNTRDLVATFCRICEVQGKSAKAYVEGCDSWCCPESEACVFVAYVVIWANVCM